jgi:hypothetical protein
MAGVGAVAVGAIGVRGSAAGRRRIPTLEVDGEVNAVASAGGLVIAVGAVGLEPTVWTHDQGDDSWAMAAGGSSFPPGTVLAAATGLAGSFVAVGHTVEISRVETIVNERTGRPVQIPVHATVPAIFRSGDGVRWEQVARGAPGAPLGGFGEVAASEDLGTLAVGFRSLEPGVGGAYGLVALSSGDGRRWSAATLPGVTPPRHGAVTLLARLGRSAVLATRGIHEVGLYLSSAAGWQRIETPAGEVTYKAAAGEAGGFLLAGVDDLSRTRIWKRTGGGWRELQGLPGLRGGTITHLARIGASLVAAVVEGGRAIVAEVGE